MEALGFIRSPLATRDIDLDMTKYFFTYQCINTFGKMQSPPQSRMIKPLEMSTPSPDSVRQQQSGKGT